MFINTDCVLPFDEIIDWKKYVIWVDEKEMSSDSIIKVVLPNDITVTDREHIRDWIVNTDKATYDVIQNFVVNTLNEEKVNNNFQHTCSKCNAEFSSDIDFDPTSFFG